MDDTTAITPQELVQLGRSSAPFAILDLREPASFGLGHILYASNLPLSRLELLAGLRLPALSATLVLVDSDPARLDLATARLRDRGYGHLRHLAGGPKGWQDAGYRLHIGTNVPSKLLGEFVAESGAIDMRPATPATLTPNTPVWDCRTHAEFQAGTLPAAVNVPGTSWPYALAGCNLPATAPVFVTCAGRTRGAITTRSLRLFGGLTAATWLEDGLAGWQLTGNAPVEPGTAMDPRPLANAALRALREHISVAAKAAGVRTIDAEAVSVLTRNADAYFFDVTTHPVPTAHQHRVATVAGGQLVQTADDHIPVRNIPVILFDDPAGEAFIAAYWLLQLGYHSVRVAEGLAASDLDFPPTDLPVASESQPIALPVEAAATLATQPGVLFLDLSTRMQFLASHPKGARHCNRTSLAPLLDQERPHTVLLTGSDIELVGRAARDIEGAGLSVMIVAGGNQAWFAQGGAVEIGAGVHPVEIDDYPPPDAPLPDRLDRLRNYIAWEYELIGLSLDDPLEPASFASDYRSGR